MEQMEQNNQRNAYWSGLLSGLLLAILLLGSIFIGKQVFRVFEVKKVVEESQSKEAKLLNDYTTAKVGVLEDTINQYYLEEVDRSQLEHGIYNGLVSALKDPYSVYYSAEELQELQMSTEGIYYGIGAYLSKVATDDYCVISGTIENTPAEEAGLRADDIIYKVDGIDVTGMDIHIAVIQRN